MATITAERCTDEFIGRMCAAGVDGVRINSAHADAAAIKEMVAKVRRHKEDMDVLIDTKGPEMRTTHVGNCREVELGVGNVVELRGIDAQQLTQTDSSKHPVTTAECIWIGVPQFHSYLEEGMRVLIDDGAICMIVESVDDDRGVAVARVEDGGLLGGCKTVALSSGLIPPMPAVSHRDRLSLEAAIEAGANIVAHSFVRSAADVEAVKEIVGERGVKVYAKIECRSAIKNMEEIARAADGVLVARGDLGAAVPLYEMPLWQQRIMTVARESERPTIVSTQILQSMMSNPWPTRAETSDVALAVVQGADCLLLCGETAQGEYPIEAIEMMRLTADSVTNHIDEFHC